MKRYLIIVLTICLCIFSGCGIKNNTTVVLTTGLQDNEVFYIEHSCCDTKEFMVYLANIKNQYESSFGTKIFEIENDGVYLEDTLKSQVIEKLASVKIMNLLAENKGISLDDEELTLVKNAANAYYSSLSEEEKKFFDVDYDKIEKMYKELSLSNKTYDYLIADINPEISDDEARTITVWQIYVKTFYTNENGEKESLSDISLEEAKEKIDTAYYLLVNEGADFSNVASEYSDDETLSYSFGKGVMNEKYEKAAFALSKGEVSDIIQTEDGYYIIKCITTFNKEETDRNKIKIVEERRKEVFEEEYNAFTKGLIRTLNEKAYDSISVPNNGEITTDSFFTFYEMYINS